MVNDYQPEEHDDEIAEHISNSDYLYHKDIELLSNEKMKCGKPPYVLQYYVPTKEAKPEQYDYHISFGKNNYLHLNQVLGYKGSDGDRPRILFFAPTGVAAITINGTTTHSGLGIND